MTNLSDFLRRTPLPALQSYFATLPGVRIEEVNWTSPIHAINPHLLQIVDTLDDDERRRILVDIERVSHMTDEAGQTALYSVTSVRQLLDGFENGHARALWMFLNDQDGFERAEDVRFTDERRHGRMWDSFIAPAGLAIAPLDTALRSFQCVVAECLESRNVHVDIYDRSRHGTTTLVQASVYHEGRIDDVREFRSGKLVRRSLAPVLEAALTYDSYTGTIEIVATRSNIREQLVRLFADHLLKTKFDGRVPLRRYSLDVLRAPHMFPTDPEDNIESVSVKSLRLMPYDTQSERINLECLRGAQRTVWDMASSRLRGQPDRITGYAVTQARLIIRFGPQKQQRGRTLPLTITMPTGCDLRDRTERERLVGEKYLYHWGFVQEI